MDKRIDKVEIIIFFFIMIILWFFAGTYLAAGIDWLTTNGENNIYVLLRFIILVLFIVSNILYWVYTSDRR